jgi:mono/diheme cytochrome c family protein
MTAHVLRSAGILVGIGVLWVLLVPVPVTTERIINEQPSATNGQILYTAHCAGCHGERGDGNGVAARFLYPRPRDFTAAEYRLTSTTNLVPTDDDLMNAINRGMPGSAMIPFAHLPEADRKAIVQYVRQLTVDGMVRRAVADAKVRGESPDEKELRTEIAEFFKPGEKLEVPKNLPAFNDDSVKRGQALYTNNCATCHGPTGRGDGQQDQREPNGMPTRPRDFSRGIFKGGRELEQLYYRIVLGMKGTPMPGNTALKPEEVGDIINYVHSLSTPDSQAKIEHKRTTIQVRRIAGELPADLTPVWESVKPTSIVISPLWWRDYPEPDLQVKAVHDGKSIAFRLVWNDGTRDDVIAEPDQFEDMASIQLYRGPQPEPFIGMGTMTSALDLWLWRATWDRAKADVAYLDEYPGDTDFYRESFKNAKLPDFATARAAGNPHTHADATQSASNITVGGPGSVTFRPRASQVVTATSSFRNRRWAVEFRRPLTVPPDAGISLTSGTTAAIAFAIWDGGYRDRNGQKQVSIWHDLRME